MQYFGYLGRDPNSGPDTDFSGYNFWLNKLDSFNGDFRNVEMVKAFLVAGEYRRRFPRQGTEGRDQKSENGGQHVQRSKAKDRRSDRELYLLIPDL